MSHRIAPLLAVLLLLSGAVAAAPRDYSLGGRSAVNFFWQFGGDTFQGRMGITDARLRLDFDDLASSQVDVALDAAAAEAGFPFATGAMRGPRVLNTGSFPQIRFHSRSVTRTGPATARLDGDLTVRGVTRPVSLVARLSRSAGSDPGSLERLTVQIEGGLERSDFGADGWSDLVGDRVDLRITAEIVAR